MNAISQPIVPGVEYATPAAPASGRHSALSAIVLCTPGLLCWTLLGGLISGLLPSRVVDFVSARLIVPLVAIAVITAISSIFYYIILARLRKPWFVILNLVINIGGLLFLGCTVLLLFLAARH